MRSTVSLFRYLFEHLPPLFPEEDKLKMRHALEHLENDPTVPLESLEDTMIFFGYLVWPWNQAYQEFLALAEGEVGEHFLLPRLSASLQEKYNEFKAYNGTLRDLFSGRPAEYFESEERAELCTALVDMQKDLCQFVGRKVVGIEKKKYLQRVEDFKKVLKEIREKLNEMVMLSEREQDHPNLANEIRARVRMFEQGLCHLAPIPDYEAVCQSVDFFHGRKKDLSRLRGAHLIPEIDFYNL
jgi:hypothetical protein